LGQAKFWIWFLSCDEPDGGLCEKYNIHIAYSINRSIGGDEYEIRCFLGKSECKGYSSLEILL
jgi:hypothetical protein